jgi:N-acetylmuramoyl-L-alanine amidase
MMRRRDFPGGALVLLLGAQQIAWGAGIVAVRVWPAREYTRVTIETDARLGFRHTLVEQPPRLAIDVEGLELNASLRELVAKVQADDPYIAGVRVGQFAPGVVRLVFDLKQAAAPQVFTLTPVAAYQHRLVFDLYPARPVDPLEAWIAQRMAPATNRASPRPCADDRSCCPCASRHREHAGRHSVASDRGRTRCGPWWRRPGCDRSAGHPRKGRGAADCPASSRAARPHDRRR